MTEFVLANKSQNTRFPSRTFLSLLAYSAYSLIDVASPSITLNQVIGNEIATLRSDESSSIGTSANVSAGTVSTIDNAIRKEWELVRTESAERAGDSVFARRVYLDLIGRIPTESELNSFIVDSAGDKRISLVDLLLGSKEHATHFAQVYDAILIGRTSKRGLDRRTEAGWISYLEQSVGENRPWDKVAEEILLARNEQENTRGANWYLFDRKDKPQAIAEAVSKDFFGVRIDCAQCHNHPLASEIEQRHYWGLVAFFNRTKNVGGGKTPRLSESAIGGFSDFSNIEGESYPNKLVFFGNKEIEEARPAADAKIEDSSDLYAEESSVDGSENKEYKVPKFSRREQFVKVVLKDHPMLGQSMVNRMWGWMMGRGIVHPVDAIDSYHPASHPELLEQLSADFVASGYDVRKLVRALALSEAYQLSSTRSAAQKGPVDPALFSVFNTKPLTAEMLHRSMLAVLEPKDLSHWGSVESRVAFSQLFPDVLAEESMANVSQGLMLTNGEWINKVTSPENSLWIERLIAKYPADSDGTIREMFVRIFAREPDDEERIRLAEYLQSQSKGDGKISQALSNAVWAMLTSSEFRFNH